MRYSTLTSECASDTTICASRWTVSVHVLCADWKEVAKSAELSLHPTCPGSQKNPLGLSVMATEIKAL